MNKITPIDQAEGIRISSRDIAEVTEKKHAHVCRDIRKMCDELEISQSKFGSSYLNSRNQEQTEYMLDRKHADCLALGYSVKFRMAILDRLEELEALSAPRVLTYEEQVERTIMLTQQRIAEQQKQIETMKPKAALHDLKHDCGTAISGKDFSDRLPFGVIKLYEILRGWNWMCKKTSHSPTSPTRYAIERGYLKAKTFTGTRSSGEPFEKISSVITEKGQQRIMKKLGIESNQSAA